MKESIIETEYGHVYYWVSDMIRERRTIVFLHGLTANHTMFDRQSAFFAKRYNIITWDAPAHGKSRPYSNFTYPNTVEALYKILQNESIEKAVLVGQSMGGYIAQSFIMRHPDLVEAFVSIDSTPFGNYYSKSDTWWLRQIEWMSKLVPAKCLKKSIAQQNAITEQGQENMRDMLAAYSKSELCHLMGIGYASFLDENCELHITCPVLLLLGEKDRTGKVQNYNRRWSGQTGFPLEIIPDAAHNSNVDNPDAVNKCIEEFIMTSVLNTQ
ncbi:MAG: alpha/beta hydrolase [Lachnospiraceae bacterium]|nr:alpha/beta hydrolase [Lachnospiraceae bacterium]